MIKQLKQKKTTEPVPLPNKSTKHIAVPTPPIISTKSVKQQKPEAGFNTMSVHGPGLMEDKLGSVIMPIYQVHNCAGLDMF
jgi:hypothetical protein